MVTMTRSNAQKHVNNLIKKAGLPIYRDGTVDPMLVLTQGLNGYGYYEGHEFGPGFAHSVGLSINWEQNFDFRKEYNPKDTKFTVKTSITVSSSRRTLDETLAYGELIIRVANLAKTIEDTLEMFTIIPDPEAIEEHIRAAAESNERVRVANALREQAEKERRAAIAAKAAATRKANKEWKARVGK